MNSWINKRVKQNKQGQYHITFYTVRIVHTFSQNLSTFAKRGDGLDPFHRHFAFQYIDSGRVSYFSLTLNKLTSCEVLLLKTHLGRLSSHNQRIAILLSILVDCIHNY